MTQECPRAAPAPRSSVSVEVQAATLNVWRAGVIVGLARDEITDRALLGESVSGARLAEHVERVDAILAGAAALLRELHAELEAVDDRLVGRRP